jgi:hypothetical protein
MEKTSIGKADTGLSDRCSGGPANRFAIFSIALQCRFVTELDCENRRGGFLTWWLTMTKSNGALGI